MLNLSRATVRTVVRNYNTIKSYESKARTGRPKKLSRRKISPVLKEVNANPRLSALKLADHITNIAGKSIHPRIMCRTLISKVLTVGHPLKFH